ncbi:cuticle collagen 2C-like [Anomalospiza imberbis]|uniref:cuticle collagen 2C-like n=1 Tax=Anomalospiza imberbis TaxID=187417 RepID=UPI00358E5693
MTTQVFWLLCVVIRSSSGSLLYAEKPGQALSKDVSSSAAAADAQVTAPARGAGSASGNAGEGRLPGAPPAPPQQPKPPRISSPASDKRKRAEPSLENSTGLRKRLGQRGGLPVPGSPSRGAPPGPPEPGRANRRHSDRRLAGAANSVGGRALRAAPAHPKAMGVQWS